MGTKLPPPAWAHEWVNECGRAMWTLSFDEEDGSDGPPPETEGATSWRWVCSTKLIPAPPTNA